MRSVLPRIGIAQANAAAVGLDRKKTTKLSLKYRRGKGQILMVNRAGRPRSLSE